MPSKRRMLLPFLALPLLAGALSARLIDAARLKAKRRPFVITRNLFETVAPRAVENPREAAMTPQAQKTIAEEIRESIKFAGFYTLEGKTRAVLNVSGEFHYVQEGDVILERIKILRISRAKVTIEYEGQSFEISLDKGNENGQNSDER